MLLTYLRVLNQYLQEEEGVTKDNSNLIRKTKPMESQLMHNRGKNKHMRESIYILYRDLYLYIYNYMNIIYIYVINIPKSFKSISPGRGGGDKR